MRSTPGALALYGGLIWFNAPCSGVEFDKISPALAGHTSKCWPGVCESFA